MDEVTRQLTVGVHTVAVCEPWVEKFQDHVKKTGYVQITFTQIGLPSGLGVELDPEKCDFETADFEGRRGQVHLEGTVTLNREPFRCVAFIDLSTLDGTGYLVPREESEPGNSAVAGRGDRS